MNTGGNSSVATEVASNIVKVIKLPALYIAEVPAEQPAKLVATTSVHDTKTGIECIHYTLRYLDPCGYTYPIGSLCVD